MKKERTPFRMPERKVVGRFDSGLGTICIFSATIGNMAEVESLLESESIKNADPKTFNQTLASVVCCPQSALVDGQMPDESAFSLDDARKLSEGELEEFAEKYTKANSYLYRETATDGNTRNRDDSEMATDADRIKHPQEDGESYVNYLHRLFVTHIENLTKPFNDLKKKFAIQFPPYLSDAMKKQFELLKFSTSPASVPSIMHTPSKEPFDFKSIENPSVDVARKLNLLIDSSERSTEVLSGMNTIQMGVATEIKASSDLAASTSKTNIDLTRFIIILSILSLLMASMSMIFDIKAGKDQQVMMQKGIDQIGGIWAGRQVAEIEALRRDLENSRNQINVLSQKVKSLENPQETKPGEHTPDAQKSD